MKKILFSAAVACVALFNACSDNLLDVKFNLDMGKVTFVLPAQTTVGTYDLDPTVVSFNLDSIAQANGVSLSKFQSIKVKSVTFKTLSPAGANFDPLVSAEAWVREPGSGLATGKRIASIDNIPKGLTSIDLVVFDENILDIVKVPFEVAAKVTTDEPVSQATSIEATIVLEVIANPTK